MKRNLRIAVLIVLGLAVIGVHAQETGEWRPVGTAAKFTTGYVSLSDGKISFQHASFAITPVRPLTRDEIRIIFMLEAPVTDRGNLYRIKIPKVRGFLHKNKICDGGDANWLATHVYGDVLELYFYTGIKIQIFPTKPNVQLPALVGLTVTGARPNPLLRDNSA